MTVIISGRTYSTAEYPIHTEPSILEKKRDGRWFLRITICGRYEDAVRDFMDGASLLLLDDDGSKYDKSEFSIAGDIVDHRDGRLTVYMGKPTEAEKEKARADELTRAAQEWRSAAEHAEAKLKLLLCEAENNADLKSILERVGVL